MLDTLKFLSTQSDEFRGEVMITVILALIIVGYTIRHIASCLRRR